jgi:PTH1 family peptidyl-tRNA hydrolase
MVLIVGLGNPGKSYEFTRHNIGFRIADKVTDNLEKKKIYRKFSSLVTESTYNRKKLIILKPQTFMNDSGTAVDLCCRFFGKKIKPILVIHDDIDIDFGELKMKSGGNTGGHKGLESIVEKLGSHDFNRLRFGLGRPPGRQDPSDYVLEEFGKREREEVEICIIRSLDMIKDYLEEGIEYAMNKYN